MLLLKTLLPLFFCVTCLGLEDNAPFVTTPLGKIRGHHKTSFTRRKFSAFEGIPYAKPPIGQRRFEEPEPIDQWDETWNATHLYECAQIHSLYSLTSMSGAEDCLYVNVYVPRERINPSEKLDVIVDIHGGGFMALSGHTYAHPGYLIDHDVIFVTFNYRLGLLGFLSTEDDVLPGNNGLKDQVLALKWVQNNIASFGGDPRSVTITGASAGGASVQLHYLSPMSVGLFKRGFSQSGCALNPWVFQKGALDKARSLALAVGCPQSPNRELKECLKNRPYQQLLNQFRLFTAYKFHPLVPFGPVIERKCSNPFLAEHPKRLLADGRVQGLPWMVSFVEHDGYANIAEFRNKTDEISRDWGQALPYLFFYNYTVPRQDWGKLAKRIKEFYFGGNVDVTDTNYDKFTRFSTDRMTLTGTVQAVRAHAKATHAPTYLFDLSYTGDNNIIAHAEDLKYFYYDENEKPLSRNDLKMKDLLVKMLVSYVKTGTPGIRGVNWKTVLGHHHQLNYLNISGFEAQDFHVQSDDDLGNQRFWDSLGYFEFN